MRTRTVIAAAILAALSALALSVPAHAAITDPNKVTLYKSYTFRAGEQITGGGAGAQNYPVRFSWEARETLICKQTFNVSTDDFTFQDTKTTPPWTEGYNYTVHTGLGGGTAVWEFKVTNKYQSTCNNYPGTVASDQRSYQVNPPEQEDSSTVSYTGTGWQSESGSQFSGGSTKFSRKAGDRVTFTYGGNTNGFVTTTGPGYGKAAIYVDGAKRATIDLNSATVKNRYIGYSFFQDTTAVHKLTIEVIGNGRVDADAFLFAKAL